jgi:hypothetical protein
MAPVPLVVVGDDALCDNYNDGVVLENEAEQVFDRRIAVKLNRVFLAQHG